MESQGLESLAWKLGIRCRSLAKNLDFDLGDRYRSTRCEIKYIKSRGSLQRCLYIDRGAI